MEPEVSLPYSQVPATCSCPEPSRANVPTSHFLKIHLYIILPYTLGILPKYEIKIGLDPTKP
jgi:hypothetical protein